jgi:hypothetical protein
VREQHEKGRGRAQRIVLLKCFQRKEAEDVPVESGAWAPHDEEPSEAI